MSYSIDEKILYIFTDGSSRPLHNEKLKKKTGRHGGEGIWFVYYNDEFELKQEDESDYISYDNASNNDMELQAAIDGLKLAYNKDLDNFLKIMVISDSTFLKNGAYNSQNIWPKTKWYGIDKEPIKHVEQRKELTKIIHKIYDKHQKYIYFDWTPAHTGDEFNEKADKSAGEGARSYTRKTRSKTLTLPRRKFLKSKPGKVGMEGQEILIHIIGTTRFKQQKTNKYKYEVISRDSPYFNRINDIYFDKYLSAEKIYKVKFSDDNKNRFIVDIISTEEKNNIKQKMIDEGQPNNIFFD